jgi:hypothetical protein
MECSESLSTMTVPRVRGGLIPGPIVSSEEQVYLEWFIHGTASNTPRIFNSPFWDPVILQATMHEPMVLHALLALSSAHKRKILDPVNQAREGLLPDAQEVFLLKQYSGAITNMQKHLANEKRPTRPKLLLAVIMCALFVLLEYTRGRYDNGYVHLTSGAKLAKQLTEESSGAQFDVKLVHFFARLQDQTNVFRMIKPSSESDTSTSTPTMPAAIPTLRFEDVAEAGHHLDALVDSMAHSAEQARQIPLSAKGSRRMLEEEHAYLMASVESWLLAYDATMAERSAQMSSADTAQWQALRQRFAMAMDLADIGIIEADVSYTGDKALRKMANCIAVKGYNRAEGKAQAPPLRMWVWRKRSYLLVQDGLWWSDEAQDQSEIVIYRHVTPRHCLQFNQEYFISPPQAMSV